MRVVCFTQTRVKKPPVSSGKMMLWRDSWKGKEGKERTLFLHDKKISIAGGVVHKQLHEK